MQIDYPNLKRYYPYIQGACMNPRVPGMTTQVSRFKMREPLINAPVSHLKMQEPGVNIQGLYFPARGYDDKKKHGHGKH
jgi:hypothetical protein